MAEVADLKRIAGERAADEARDGMLVGLGTGSNAVWAIRRLAQRMREEGLHIRGVPTSLASEQLATELGIPLAPFDEAMRPDLAIDGADEIDPAFNMIKGGGGALLREKVVARRARRVVIAVEPKKLVKRLGESFALPIEVVPVVWRVVADELVELGAAPALRTRDGQPFLSDNGNYILDARFSGIDHAAELARRLNEIPGVVENGLFVGLCHVLVVGRAEGAEVLRPAAG